MTAPTPGYPTEISSHDLHWLAGLLEGEGSFLKGPPSAPGLPVLSLQMTDEDVVARVASMFGRKLISWQAPNANWQRTFIARASGRKAVAWMVAVRPLMGHRRGLQIDEAIASYAPKAVALLDDDAASRALRLLASGMSVRAVATEFGTSIWCIYDLRGGRTRKHLLRE